jgi:CheY-like chemotaxis protein
MHLNRCLKKISPYPWNGHTLGPGGKMTDREKFDVVPLAEVLRRTRDIQTGEGDPEYAEEPASPLADAKPVPQTRQRGDPGVVKAKVLVVDDEHIIADSLAAILQCKGYDAKAFYDGESALAACMRDAPDCVISDVVMPGMTGFDLAIAIRDRFPECRVLLFSGQAATAEMLERVQDTGLDFELLMKPVHPTDLLARLEGSQKPIPPQMRKMSAGMVQ